MNSVRIRRGLLKAVEVLLIPIALFAAGVWIEPQEPASELRLQFGDRRRQPAG